jgi:hypothetical protein
MGRGKLKMCRHITHSSDSVKFLIVAILFIRKLEFSLHPFIFHSLTSRGN